MFVNVLVFFAWRVLDPRLMTENFTTSWSLAFGEWRLWTLITSVFSHESLVHLVINMLVLRSFGGLMSGVLGWRRFFGAYVLFGLAGSFGHDAVSKFVLDDPALMAVGASGALAGVVLLFSLMFPRERILLFGLLPVPAVLGALAFVGLDLWGLSAQYAGGGLPLGHGAHLGGAAAGALYSLFVVRPTLAPRLH